MSSNRVLGINALGRIGKLTLWHHLGGNDFDAFVMNAGRNVGLNMDAVIQYLTKDSTYGSLHKFLHGFSAKPDVQVLDEAGGLLRIEGKEVRVLREARNPKDIPWRDHGVAIVVDTTGVFKDPTIAPDASAGALRGHLAAGARVAIQSSAFKIKDKNASMPDDAIMLINGINNEQFDAARHSMVSCASCTTTGLAHMVKPLLENDLTRNILTMGMGTIHAVTNTQSVLDSVPAAGAKDLRKTRSILNNIILTSTNAAKALEEVMPEVRHIGFMADSVRVPTSTASLIVLNATLQTEMNVDGTPAINREVLANIYREASEGAYKGLVKYSEDQNVSTDMIGEDAAIVIEAREIHTRTGFLKVRLPDRKEPVDVPVTHVKIFGWYDNEMGSYTHRMGELTCYVKNCL
jgi:glyceraldehyde 3-phosphate dehydrogenase